MSLDAGHRESHDVQIGDARFSPEALTLDTLRAARNLELGRDGLRDVLCADDALVTGVLGSEQRLFPDTDPGARAILLVRLNRALGDVFGSQHRVQEWLGAFHPELEARPGTLMRRRQGLIRVLEYIESHAKDFAWTRK